MRNPTFLKVHHRLWREWHHGTSLCQTTRPPNSTRKILHTLLLFENQIIIKILSFFKSCTSPGIPMPPHLRPKEVIPISSYWTPNKIYKTGLTLLYGWPLLTESNVSHFCVRSFGENRATTITLASVKPWIDSYGKNIDVKMCSKIQPFPPAHMWTSSIFPVAFE